MIVKVNKISEDLTIIEWSTDGSCGQIEFKWDNSIKRWIVDTEYLDVEFLINVLKEIK